MFYEDIQPQKLKDFLLDPTHDTLCDLLLHNTGETDFLDFKAKWIDLTKLAKHILAIANSGGGSIIVGVGQQADGSSSLDGLSNQDFLDKADVDNKLGNYLPSWVKYRTEDFIFDGQASAPFTDKKFQVLIIEYDPKYVPYTSIISRGELRYGAIYIRQGTKSIEASNEKLLEIILRKVKAGDAYSTDLTLIEHLTQLKHLYAERNRQADDDYERFIERVIERKQRRIEQVLDVYGMADE
ncbi:RNA-binding domain-containing protein [Aneurinibacillus uraniidurans]|uniref:RNA-binding domain-containing protein n=1 Tax=Aneurinibacillus uraniidurans TaxID=2966586 RepID=UPI00234BD889|nr:RNA-binding domain-containing protein [Aneurinibacillus sp. B1]WCN38634.1 putative DNA binding domain-containing protein [Aneurinibacillus sp. B1]